MLLGYGALVVACVTAWRRGGAAEREGAVLIGASWLAALAGQLAVGARRVEPLILCDLLYGLGLLYLTYKYSRAWLWLSLAFEAVTFLMHACLYQLDDRPSYSYMATLNVFSFCELGLLVCGALFQPTTRPGAVAARAMVVTLPTAETAP